VLVLTFVVILITLVGQAPTLGPLIRRLGIAREGGGGGDPHAEHRRRIAAAGLAALAAKADDPLEGAIARDLLPELSLRAGTTPDGGAQAIEAMARLVLLLEARAAERRALLGLHRAGELDDDALRVLQEELDLEELRLRRSLAAMRGG
jgi:CPA1 family monovalent cation:H+ antiporter